MTNAINTVDAARFTPKAFKPLTLTESDWASWHRQSGGWAPSTWGAKKWVSGVQAVGVVTVAAFRDRERRTDAWELTLPSGASFLVARGPRSRVTSSSDAARWLAAQGVDLALAIAQHLGRSKYEDEKKQAQEAKDRDAGKMTCPHCLRKIKASRGTMADHGFKRPGWGVNIGGCSGWRYAPLEVSRSGADDRVEMLKAVLAEAPERLAKAEAAVREARTYETLKALSQARQLPRAAASDLKTLEALLAEWKPTHRFENGEYVKI